MESDNANERNELEKLDFVRKIYIEHSDFLREVIACCIKDDALAEDIFQDIFISLLSRRHPRHVYDIRSYLYRSARNSITDKTRRAKQSHSRLDQYASQKNPPVTYDISEGVLMAEEETNKWLRLISHLLPNHESRAITLRYKNNFSIQQIASMMKISTKSASIYISRGLKKLSQSSIINILQEY